MNKQTGFTLIELIVVIVILGILSAVAVPKYISLEVDAYDAQAKAIGGTITSASSINYAKSLVGTPTLVVNSTTACSSVLSSFAGDLQGTTTAAISMVTPADKTVGCTGAAGLADTTCKVKSASGTATGFTVSVICTG
ncbi:MAG: prepilin-type N-terminal cleavage/methylation domain-containing protein [Sterolibacterium sp.]